MADFAARRTMMVDTQIRPSDVTKFPIIEAMLDVPREIFVPSDLREAAYADTTLDIGGRQMLEPRVFAKLIDALGIGPGDVVLDIGCGLGYSSAVLAHMCDAVVAIEDDAARAEEAQTLLSGEGIDNAAVIEGALAAGAPKHGPYDVILIEGGVEVVPDALIEQLRPNGRIGCIFIEGALRTARVGYRDRNGVDWRDAFNASADRLEGFARDVAFQF